MPSGIQLVRRASVCTHRQPWPLLQQQSMMRDGTTKVLQVKERDGPANRLSSSSRYFSQRHQECNALDEEARDRLVLDRPLTGREALESAAAGGLDRLLHLSMSSESFASSRFFFRCSRNQSFEARLLKASRSFMMAQRYMRRASLGLW
mmetsp:Transcript_102837/g.299993  ORF Transcript_102837/g.299993 Transcript_102837/m.299993 type:complete len:149 (-) Transcript_102837:143-589(-)